MAYNRTFAGRCPAPFYDATLFNTSSPRGSLDSRICLSQMPDCCLPCPVDQWIFDTTTFGRAKLAASGMSVVGFALLVFILAGFVVLPKADTHQGYLKTCLVVSVLLLQIGFVVPLADRSSGKGPCADAITPHDMWSSTPCAASGAAILFGGIAGTTWCFVCVCSLHLKLFWQVKTEEKVFWNKFYYYTQFGGWMFSVVIFVATMSATGVSYRLGSGICHINYAHAMADFWGWILTIAGLALVVEMVTWAYCLYILFRKGGDKPTKAMLRLQWRELVMVTFVLTAAMTFAAIFVRIDQATSVSPKTIPRMAPWVSCLFENPDNPSVCRTQAEEFMIKQSVVSGALLLLSSVGNALFLILIRPTFFTGWVVWGRSIFGKTAELPICNHSRYAWRQRGTPRDALGGTAQAGRGADEVTVTSFQSALSRLGLSTSSISSFQTSRGTDTTRTRWF